MKLNLKEWMAKVSTWIAGADGRYVNTTGDTMTGNLVINGQLSVNGVAIPNADYIVEQGTSGIWTYRKWNSGIAECWGQSSSEQTFAQSTFGNTTAYYSYNNVEFPFSFVGTPIVTIGAHDTAAGLCSGEVDGVNSRYAIVRIVGANSNWTVATIDVHAIGRWK